MRIRHVWPIVAMFSIAGDAALAAARRESVALTVYNQNFALVKDVRVLNLTSGSAELRVDDVAASIDPTSVHFAALDHPDAVAVLEQNYQYDLADADRLLTRYLNHPVTVKLKEGSGHKEGTLLSYGRGDLVLRTGKGVSIVNRTEVREVALGEVPGGLVVKPALFWKLASERQGPERVELSYLTDNITWHAEYVAVVNAKDDGLTLNGWVSLDNRSGAGYENAKLKLVAGDVHRVRERVVRSSAMALRSSDAISGVTRPQFAERRFFEYHTYTLDRPATVADKETKQLALFPSATVAAKKKLTYEGGLGALDDVKVAIQLEFKNSKENGLGIPLPKGTLRVYKEDADQALEFVGEDNIDHTARDETVRIFLGNAFDVVGERRQTNHKQLSTRTSEDTFSIDIRNHKDESIEVSVIEHFRADWKITDHSHDFVKKDARTAEFPLTVASNKSITVVYTVETKW